MNSDPKKTELRSRLEGPKKSGQNLALYAILAVGLLYLVFRIIIYLKAGE